MKLDYSATTNVFFAQAYGGDEYGAQFYSGCEQTSEGCIPVTTTQSPNTGFMGLSPDAAIASASGALLIAVAVVGIVYVVLSRRRSRKNKSER